jgi:thioredoxin-related protein
MLQTMVLSFIILKWRSATILQLPVAVTIILACGIAFSSVNTWKPSIAACKAQKTNVTKEIKPSNTNNIPLVNYKEIGAPLPEFKVVRLDGTKIVRKDAQYDGNLFIMFFNPTCGHCEEFTETLKKNIFLFKKTKVIMVAGSMMQPYLPDFIKKHELSKYPTLTMGVDSSEMINKMYMYQSLPQLNIYNKERKLIKFFTGDIAIDSIRSYIN